MSDETTSPEISALEAAALADPAVMAAVREARLGDRSRLQARPLPEGD
jgi:hypothetical protein